jgi:eukaryotic-like serine/threonine-protein kinase
MSDDRIGPLEDEHYIAWLAGQDDALAAGFAGSTVEEDSSDFSVELHDRVKVDVAWCEFVRAAWIRPRGSPAVEKSQSVAELTEPTRFGRFEVQRELGRGSFGVVFLAYDPRLRRQVALKVPRPEVLVTAEMRRRFEREARAAAGLDHPNLVPVFDAGEEGSISYIASAYCPGPTLATWLKERSEPVPPRLAARIVAMLARAIAHAHSRGVLHRDLKPGNVIMEPISGGAAAQRDDDRLDYIPRVTDFGLARLSGAGQEATSATQSGVILGTPSYMAPEQAKSGGDVVGPPADVYGLGAILYALLVGRPPFQADSVLDTLLLVRTQEPVAPSRLRPRLPRDLETVCQKCLCKEPRRRYATADLLADDLDRFLAGQPVRARRVGRTGRFVLWCRREPALAGTIAAAILIISAVASAGIWRVVRERDRAEARRLEAVANLRKAREAVDRMLTRVSEVRLKELPQVEPVQRALLEDAREFYRDFVRQAQDDPEVLFDASQAYDRLSDHYLTLGWPDEAERCLDETLALQQKLAAAFPGVPVYRRALARSYRLLGRVRIMVDRKSEAVDALEKSLALLDELETADPSEPGYRSERAVTLEHRAVLRLESLGQTREAAADFRKVVDLRDELAAQFPTVLDHPKRAALNRFNLACCMLVDGRMDEAEGLFRQILGYWERLAASDASSMYYRSKTALTLDSLGEVLEKTGRKPEAELALRRSADLRLALTKDLPTEPWQFLQLGSMLARLAKLAADRGDLVAVRRLEEQALSSKRAGIALAPRNSYNIEIASTTHVALIETLIALREHELAANAISELVSFSPDSGPQCFRAGSFLAQCVPLAAAETRLTEGRRTDLAKTYADQAVERLRESRKRGYQDTKVLWSDRLFDSIRLRADFRELVAGSLTPASQHGPK